MILFLAFYTFSFVTSLILLVTTRYQTQAYVTVWDIISCIVLSLLPFINSAIALSICLSLIREASKDVVLIKGKKYRGK